MGKKKKPSEPTESLVLPMLTLRHVVLTPMIPQPVKIEDPRQKEFFDKTSKTNTMVFLGTSTENPKAPEETIIKPIGIVCIVDRVLQMPGAPYLAFVRPVYRAFLVKTEYIDEVPHGHISPIPAISIPKRIGEQTNLMMGHIDTLFSSVMRFAGEMEKETAEKIVAENSTNPLQHIYALSHVAPLSWEEKYSLLECTQFKELLDSFASLLDQAEQKISLQAALHEKTHMEISQQQKETFLRMHLKNIQEELGEGETGDIAELIEKASKMKWGEPEAAHFNKELQKLKRLNINNPEYSVQYSYLESLLELPWQNYNYVDLDINHVKEVLDRDHYGLDKVKERILEYMAVVKLRNDLKAPIICLYGPPGVGKTSIGKSVAEATGREYARISLGGMHDEAEIRGHRRTYIGAMPGRFLHALSKLKFGNPLVLLDEIDKVGKDFKGDPSSALLEALDPEQNNTFHDNFIDYPYDLSKVLFIATANELSTIPEPLKDRMEIIEMPGYTPEEKREIALRHLVNKSLEDNGFNKDEIKFTEDAIDAIVKSYTREKGVRQLGKSISRIIRKIALLKVTGKDFPNLITEKEVHQFLDHKDTRNISLGFH